MWNEIKMTLDEKLTARIAELVPGVEVICKTCLGNGDYTTSDDSAIQQRILCRCGENKTYRDPTLADVCKAIGEVDKNFYLDMSGGIVRHLVDSFHSGFWDFDKSLSGQSEAFKLWLAGVLGVGG